MRARLARGAYRRDQGFRGAELRLDQSAEHEIGLGVRGERRDMALPEFEEAARQCLDAGRLVLRWGARSLAAQCGHAASIAARHP
jgi:hypothetical protein